MQFGLVFGTIAHCKKVYDTVKNLNAVPEEAYFLWELLDGMAPAVQLATRLASREASATYFVKAVEAAYDVVVVCDTLLVRDDPEGRPTEEGSWQAWWSATPSAAKDSLTRLQLIPKMTARLQLVMTLLQLSFAAYQSSQSVTEVSGRGLDPIVGAALRARKIVHLFESGRLDCCGNVYQCGVSGVSVTEPTRGGKAVERDIGEVGLVLRRRAASHEKSFELCFVDCATGSESGKSAAVPLTAGRACAGAALSTLKSIAFSSAPWKLRRPDAAQEQSSCWVLNNDAAATTIRFRTFTSCATPSQICYFPVSSETYTHVTRETFEVLLMALICLSHKKATCYDQAVPCVEDDSTPTEVEAFLKWHEQQLQLP